MVVITRHPALVGLLTERGIIDGTEPVLTHADAGDVRNQHVIGVLPLSLAAEAASVTEVPLSLAPEDRGQELSLERLREVAGPAKVYTVTHHPRCVRCGDRPDPVHIGLGVNDEGTPGGLGPCGDLHAFV
jgi:hypothetical protein